MRRSRQAERISADSETRPAAHNFNREAENMSEKRTTRMTGLAFAEAARRDLVLTGLNANETEVAVKIAMDCDTAESIASECLRWMTARRDEYSNAIKRLAEQP